MREDMQMQIAKTPGARLKLLRQNDWRGFKTAADAARAMQINVTTYQGHENDTRGLTRETMLVYAKFYGSTLEYLVTGKLENPDPGRVPVIGLIGPGQKLVLMPREKRGKNADFVNPPPGVVGGDVVAVRIEGDSMHPLMDGWLLYWDREESGKPKDCIGKLAAITLKDGTQVFKFIHEGTAPGRYNLASWNAPEIRNVEVVSAYRIMDIKPEYR